MLMHCFSSNVRTIFTQHHQAPAEIILRRVVENISMTIKGKRKIIIMEMSPTDVTHTTVRHLVKEGLLSSIITTLLPQAAQET